LYDNGQLGEAESQRTVIVKFNDKVTDKVISGICISYLIG